jgi:4'-phosphopantetheinyl transferase
VHIWHVDASSFAADGLRVAAALDALAPPERERFERYRFDRDRQMFLAGRAMARDLVGRALGVAPGAWAWREGPHGRPEIAAPATAITFNLAHSAGLVVCAVANGREVGIDVEDRERRPTDRDLVRRYAAPDEIADIEAQGDRWRDRFLVYWTLKEAYLKARGLGIAVTLADISFSLGPDVIRVGFRQSLDGTSSDWRFALVPFTSRHVGAVAARGTGLFSTETAVWGTGLPARASAGA